MFFFVKSTQEEMMFMAFFLSLLFIIHILISAFLQASDNLLKNYPQVNELLWLICYMSKIVACAVVVFHGEVNDQFQTL